MDDCWVYGVGVGVGTGAGGNAVGLTASTGACAGTGRIPVPGGAAFGGFCSLCFSVCKIFTS